MMEHPAPLSIQAFSNRALPSADMLSLSLHMANCRSCREILEKFSFEQKEDAANAISWYSDAGIAGHLSGEEIATAAAGQEKLEEGAILHLKTCLQCLQEMEELRRFCPPQASMQNRLVPFRNDRFRWPAWAGGAVAAAILVTAAMHFHSVKLSKVTHAPADVELIASLHDGVGNIGLDTNGELRSSQPFPPKYASMLVQALTTRQLPLSPDMANDQEVLRGESSEVPRFAALSPVSEKTTTVPEFRWQALPDVENYHVEVFDRNYNLVARSPALQVSSWTIAVSLKPGEKYSWVVRAKTPRETIQAPRPPQQEARFQVADRDSLAELVSVARQFPQSHLLLASLYAKAGLRSLAGKEISELEIQNKNSSLVHDLAASFDRKSKNPEKFQSLPNSWKPAQ